MTNTVEDLVEAQGDLRHRLQHHGRAPGHRLPDQARRCASTARSSSSPTRGASRSSRSPTSGCRCGPAPNVALLNGMMHGDPRGGARRPRLHRGAHRGLRRRSRRCCRSARRSGRREITGVPAEGHPPRRPALRRRRAARRSATRWGSPSTPRGRTTCWRSPTSRCSPATSASAARASTRCAGRTTSRAPATWARCPNYYTAYQKVADPEARAKFEKAWGVKLPSNPGLTLGEMIDGAAAATVRALYVMGENPRRHRPGHRPRPAAPSTSSTSWSSRTSS